MSQPVQNLSNARQFHPLRQGRTVDHQHRQAQRPRGIQLGPRAKAACVLGHDQLDLMTLHQRLIISQSERPARDNNIAVRQRQVARFIDQSQQVAVLGLGSKVVKMHPAHGQKHQLRRTGKRGNCAVDIRNMVPAVSVLFHPRRTGQRSQRHPNLLASGHRIGTHLRGEGVRGVDHMGYSMVAQIGGQTGNAPEPAYAHRQRLRARIVDPTGIGVGRWDAPFGHGFGQGVGLGGAAKDQEMCHA